VTDQEHWQRLKLVFDLDSPDEIGDDAVVVPADSDELRVFQRYVRAASDLEASSVLQPDADFGYTVTFDDDGEDVEVDRRHPPAEIVRGLAVTFRQFYADEPASFQTVLGRLFAKANPALEPVLRRWGAAAGSLRGRFFEDAVKDYLVKRGDFPDGLKVVRPDRNPEQIISAYFYGEHIHWDAEKAEQIEEWARDEFTQAHFELLFLQAVTPLAMVYRKFADVVERVALDPDGSAVNH
jgi:hypothetical protein